ncbi:hypothetical protein Q5752_001981 [Cryptotrichosporon argae]
MTSPSDSPSTSSSSSIPIPLKPGGAASAARSPTSLAGTSHRVAPYPRRQSVGALSSSAGGPGPALAPMSPDAGYPSMSASMSASVGSRDGAGAGGGAGAHRFYLPPPNSAERLPPMPGSDFGPQYSPLGPRPALSRTPSGPSSERDRYALGTPGGGGGSGGGVQLPPISSLGSASPSHGYQGAGAGSSAGSGSGTHMGPPASVRSPPSPVVYGHAPGASGLAGLRPSYDSGPAYVRGAGGGGRHSPPMSSPPLRSLLEIPEVPSMGRAYGAPDPGMGMGMVGMGGMGMGMQGMGMGMGAQGMGVGMGMGMQGGPGAMHGMGMQMHGHGVHGRARSHSAASAPGRYAPLPLETREDMEVAVGGSGQTRRLAHLMSEQKRRESINTGFEALRAALPSTSVTDSKALVLRKAVTHIAHLEALLRDAGIGIALGPGVGVGVGAATPTTLVGSIDISPPNQGRDVDADAADDVEMHSEADGARGGRGLGLGGAPAIPPAGGALGVDVGKDIDKVWEERVEDVSAEVRRTAV